MLILVDNISPVYIATDDIELISIGHFLPYKSANLGTKIQDAVQPAKYMEPKSPIL